MAIHKSDYYKNKLRKGLHIVLACRDVSEYQLLSVSQRDLKVDPARFNDMLSPEPPEFKHFRGLISKLIRVVV